MVVIPKITGKDEIFRLEQDGQTFTGIGVYGCRYFGNSIDSLINQINEGIAEVNSYYSNQPWYIKLGRTICSLPFDIADYIGAGELAKLAYNGRFGYTKSRRALRVKDLTPGYEHIYKNEVGRYNNCETELS